MRMKIIYLLVLLGFALPSHAQDCGSRVKPQQVNYMRGFEEQLRGFDGALTRGIRDFPLKVHVLRRSDGTGGLSEQQVRTVLERTNQLYVLANIRFVLHENINFIPNSTYFDKFEEEQEEVFCRQHDVKNVINVYFFPQMDYCGYAHFPEDRIDRVMMNNDCVLNGTTLSHELGHYFSLYHTHETATGTEWVKRTNCQTAGDELCDTPADPNLGRVKGCTPDCAYSGTERDSRGDLYAPMADNIMSYNSYKSCRIKFTPQQFSRINFCALNQRNYLKIPNPTPVPLPKPTPAPVAQVDLSGELRFEVAGQTMKANLDANLYKMKDVYYSGTNYRLYIGNQEPAYVYVLGSDLSKKTAILFPLAGQSAYISQKNTKLALPNENTLYQLDHTLGKDYICVLYSKKSLSIEQIRQKIENEEGNFIQRVYKVLGSDMVYLNNIAYTYQGSMQFNAKSGSQSIVPIIVEMEHR